ncbi:MFS transporter [Blastococcus sp. TBT05-19]|uniref:MFS transporter n=1 Tax=Blastococcus sp. TBT05-19 TaxID=2250581 RepID=UPI000DE85EAB|nr:MFS transporter [Blastococcus sp. TBT05-19]RBY92263.1 MFS transporter [Blastococcus sp. TBT05-19]
MAAAGTTVRGLLTRGDFRRLLGTRLLAQFGDGVLQAALAGTILFNPQRAADPVDVAAGFAVLLLPYSLVGPFAGVWLDRWSRRQILLRANLVRAVLVAVVAALILAGVQGPAFLLAGLAVFSVNRFVLSALSAGLPHTTDEHSLVRANALSTTSGSVATVVGGGAALVLAPLTGSGDAGYAALALAAALPYLGSAAVVTGFDRRHLGPDHMARTARLTAGQVLAGMASGARHAWRDRPARAALTAIGLHRCLFGVLTLMALLLHRGTFTAGTGLFPGGLTGLGQVVAAGAVGTLVAAAVTPGAVARIGTRRWTGLLLVGGGTAQLGLGLLLQPGAAVAAGFVLGFVGHGVKICVDATLQERIDDDHRGRVFSVYDTVVNVGYVAALVLAAFALPSSGVSPPVLGIVAAGYLLTAVLHARMTRR